MKNKLYDVHIASVFMIIDPLEMTVYILCVSMDCRVKCFADISEIRQHGKCSIAPLTL